MSKSKKRPGRSGAPPLSPRVLGELDRAYDLIQRRKWDEAAEILESFVRRHPSHVHALAMLAEVYNERHQADQLWEITEKLVLLDPDEPDNWYNAMGVCLVNGLFFMARHYAERFISSWPDDPKAGDARKTLANLDKACADVVESESTEPGATREDLMLFEQARMWLNLGRVQQSQQVSQKVLQRLPHAAAPKNNLSLAYAAEGRLDEAIALEREVLAQHPDNVHALSNLVQFLVRSGQRAEALPVAERLPAQPPANETIVAKQIEALTFLADDRAVIAVYEQFEQDKAHEDISEPLTAHLAAVAYARQGDGKRARQLWERVLKQNPGFALAKDNLADLKRPVGEQNGAWPYSFAQWIPRPWVQRLLQALNRGKHSDAASRRETNRLLQAIPGLAAAIPILLERGDAEGRELALRIASMAGLPVLRDFALGQNGPDRSRMTAAQNAAEAGLLPRGKSVPIYVKGERQEIMLMGYDIYTKPEPDIIPKKAQQLLEKSHDLLLAGQPAEAEPFIREALTIVPNYPTLMNYLSVALNAMRRDSEAREVMYKVVEIHPDYLFGRCAVAQLCAKEGRLEEAHAWLDPLLERERFHVSEFAAFCGAYASLLAAEKKSDGARSWLDMWKGVDPDNPQLHALRRQLRL